jgi:moderate conductance mechanosensitive channel
MAALLSTVIFTLVELALIVGLSKLIYVAVTRGLERATSGRSAGLLESSRRLRLRIRNVLIVTCLVLSVVVLVVNGLLASRGINAWTHGLALLGSIGAVVWIRFGIAFGKLAVAAIGFLVAVALMRRGLRALEKAAIRWETLRDHDKSVRSVFLGFDYAIVNAGWLLLVVYAFQLFALPERVVSILVMFVRAYLVVALGVLLIRSTVIIVDVLDSLGQRYVRDRDWHRYYDRLRALIPAFRACLEYALWIAVASLALIQLAGINNVVLWGPRLIQGIGLFFVGRVVIELGRLEIDRRMLPDEGLDDTARRRRATMVPIVRSAFTYAVYFGTAVLILASLGFNPMPFLAGAGILGLVVGFGAQTLIHDVVSGFFILFENTYLVGDAIEAAGAKGVVEAIEFRTTKVRDGDGRLHVVRNGDVKQVINYSKQYALAVVAFDVPYHADLPQVFAVVREAGERIRRENPDVLGDIQIDGISAFGLETMTVRTSTRVKPGRHDAAAAALRLAIKEAFDRRSAGAPRRLLVPEEFAGVAPHVQDTILRRR